MVVITETKKRYSDEELNEFRELLIKKRERTLQTLTSYSSTPNNPLEGGDDGEKSTHGQLKEEKGDTANTLSKYLEAIDAALIRIENNRYGICRETGKLIPKERLRAVPHATTCIEVKENRDQKNRKK